MRFILSPEADQDLHEITLYLRNLPRDPALRIGKAIQLALKGAASDPLQGHIHEAFSQVYGAQIRSRVTGDYVIFYAADSEPRLILGIVHGKRDIASILPTRLT